MGAGIPTPANNSSSKITKQMKTFSICLREGDCLTENDCYRMVAIIQCRLAEGLSLFANYPSDLAAWLKTIPAHSIIKTERQLGNSIRRNVKLIIYSCNYMLRIQMLRHGFSTVNVEEMKKKDCLIQSINYYSPHLIESRSNLLLYQF